MLRLNDDRTVDLTLDDGTEVRLRPPTIGEWRKIRDAYLGADAGFNEVRDAWLEGDASTPEPTPGEYTWSDGNPYGAAFALVISELSNTAPDADRLPMWAADPRLYVALYNHWRSVQVTHENKPEAPVPAATPAVDPDGFDPVGAGLEPQPTQRPLPRALRGHVNTGQPATGS